MALRHGYTIHPAFNFGETELYSNLMPSWVPLPMRFWLNSIGLPTVIPCGRWWAPLVPHGGAQLHTVVGRPIVCPLTANPDRSMVETYHAKYVEELVRIFDAHKASAGQGSTRLDIY